MLIFSNPLTPLNGPDRLPACVCGGQYGCTGECEELLDLAVSAES